MFIAIKCVKKLGVLNDQTVIQLSGLHMYIYIKYIHFYLWYLLPLSRAVGALQRVWAGKHSFNYSGPWTIPACLQRWRAYWIIKGGGEGRWNKHINQPEHTKPHSRSVTHVCTLKALPLLPLHASQTTDWWVLCEASLNIKYSSPLI